MRDDAQRDASIHYEEIVRPTAAHDNGDEPVKLTRQKFSETQQKSLFDGDNDMCLVDNTSRMADLIRATSTITGIVLPFVDKEPGFFRIDTPFVSKCLDFLDEIVVVSEPNV